MWGSNVKIGNLTKAATTPFFEIDSILMPSHYAVPEISHEIQVSISNPVNQAV